MSDLATTTLLKEIAQGEVDLDRITEVMRSADLVIKSYRSEVNALQKSNEQLQEDLKRENEAADDLTQRLVQQHEENQLARDVFRTEIEVKRKLLQSDSLLDAAALTMSGLIAEREKVQQLLSRIFEHTAAPLR
ncbi:MAG: hypothetical protein ABIE92_03765 [bacterium]